jgi:hypothetical protein
MVIFDYPVAPKQIEASLPRVVDIPPAPVEVRDDEQWKRKCVLS